MFDTGSSLAYALSNKCEKGCPGRLTKFETDLSTSFVDYTDRRHEQNYGQGFVAGFLA
jgi:hypothetical protein